ncbi:hypothetical protein BJX99DRAFT_252856 [Aspergillus californicus]
MSHSQQRLINQETNTCRAYFEQCTQMPHLMEGEWARKRLADFNLWASGSGASGTERASLDQRLIAIPTVKKVIVNLLALLGQLLIHCHRAGEKQRPSTEGTDLLRGDSSDEYAPPESIPLSKAMDDVEDIVRQLVRIFIAIRRAGTQAREDRADRSFRADRHTELSNLLKAIVFATTLASGSRIEGYACVNPLTMPLTEIQSRLIQANLRRRHRFLYAEKRWKKQAIKHDPPTVQQIRSNETVLEERATVVEQKHHQQAPNSRVATVHALASTVPTITQNPIVIPQGSQPSMTVASAVSTRISYPMPPEIQMDHDVFVCPCCYLTLPRSVAIGPRWRKHIAEDLCPYTCVLPECPQPDILYSSRKDWMEHMTKEHATSDYWLCFACSDPTSFTEEQLFINHLLSQHGEDISQPQVPMFVSECAYHAPLAITACPLCPSNDIDCNEESGAILDHVAEHVHSFSVNSLPWPVHGEEEEEYVGRHDLCHRACYFSLTAEAGSSAQAMTSRSRDSMGASFVEIPDDGVYEEQPATNSEIVDWQLILNPDAGFESVTLGEGQIEQQQNLEDFICRPPSVTSKNPSALPLDLEYFLASPPTRNPHRDHADLGRKLETWAANWSFLFLTTPHANMMAYSGTGASKDSSPGRKNK